MKYIIKDLCFLLEYGEVREKKANTIPSASMSISHHFLLFILETQHNSAQILIQWKKKKQTG